MPKSRNSEPMLATVKLIQDSIVDAYGSVAPPWKDNVPGPDYMVLREYSASVSKMRGEQSLIDDSGLEPGFIFFANPAELQYILPTYLYEATQTLVESSPYESSLLTDNFIFFLSAIDGRKLNWSTFGCFTILQMRVY
jgi:hypothetical protein